MTNRELYLAQQKVPICRLEVKSHFDALTTAQQMYAHFLGRACWYGTRIICAQVSPYSGRIFEALLAPFRSGFSMAQVQEKSGVSQEAFGYFQDYVVNFLGNLGEYKSFGDTKFIPRCSREDLAKILSAGNNAGQSSLDSSVLDAIYALEPSSVLMLGYPDQQHTSAYYSSDVTRAEIDLVQKFLESRNISAYNTRLFKDTQNTSNFVVRLASAEVKPSETYQYEGKTIRIEYGDYQQEMAKIVEALEHALPYAGNDNQKHMLEKYIESFRTGSIDAHKESQRWWIKDVGPAVESNIGFIESYRDPAGVRGEWEGFVAMVNKEQTRKFESLVSNAPKFIAKLPWGKDFEKDRFNKPDFTSLEVMAFCTSGIPAGINIPNYDDIRQHDGFKNVSLGNILNAQAPSEVITFLTEQDKQLFSKYRGPAFEVQVGIHELLGHGSGKLLEQKSDGKFNFDPANPPKNPLTGQSITKWYKNGETYPSKFGSVGSSYEECRAESCGIFLSTDAEILSIFGHEGKEADDVVYVNWLLMVRAGLLALEFYDPATKAWGQAHMRARFAILRVLLEAKEKLVTISPTGDFSDATIQLERQKILSVGRPIIGDFLTKLQVYKATADFEEANKLYQHYTSVPADEDQGYWIKLRELVIKKRQPRKVFVQPNTRIVKGQDGKDEVLMKEYESTAEGMIQSFLDRL